MRTMTRRLASALLLGLCAAAHGQVEERAEPSAGGYSPMFTPEMIERAAPEQARRMREAEARNRQAWERRQAAMRARREAARTEVEGEEPTEGGGSTAVDDATPPPAPVRARHSKIYRWVDKDGNVNFGDAPAGSNAEEVKVGGVARERGNPRPPPSLRGEGEGEER